MEPDDSDDHDTIDTDVECSTLREAADVAASGNRSVDVVIQRHFVQRNGGGRCS